MIVDAHCHAWPVWPYDPTVPDASTRGSLESLGYEMAANTVGHAVLVAAEIGGGGDAGGGARTGSGGGNTAWLLERTADDSRFTVFADVDSFWSPDHHRPGAAARFEKLVEESPVPGFSHYLRGDDDGWFSTPDAAALFASAERHGMLVGLHAPPPWHKAVGLLARRHPHLPILLHHQGLVRDDAQLDSLLALAAVPSIALKVSGFHYLVDQPWRYPFPAAVRRFERILRTFGAERLVWGSDFPVAPKSGIGYRQALEVVRTECAFLDDDELALILGGTMTRLLAAATSPRLTEVTP